MKKECEQKVSGLDPLLTLLHETDQLLKRVEGNLATAQEIGEAPLTTVGEIKERLDPLVEKHKMSQKRLTEKKMEVLQALCDIALLFSGEHDHHDFLRDVMIDKDILIGIGRKSNGIVIVLDYDNFVYAKGYSLSSFARIAAPSLMYERDDHTYYRFCYRMIEKEIPKLVAEFTSRASVQTQEMQRLLRLLADIAKMEMPKV